MQTIIVKSQLLPHFSFTIKRTLAHDRSQCHICNRSLCETDVVGSFSLSLYIYIFKGVPINIVLLDFFLSLPAAVLRSKPTYQHSFVPVWIYQFAYNAVVSLKEPGAS